MTVRRIAHRGFAGEYPENTLRAVRRAVPQADVIEVDVRRCGSGELVCIHDERVDRVTGASGEVSAFSHEELASLSVLGTNQGVPTLRSVLETIPDGTGVNVELKERGIAEDALSLLGDAPQEVIVSSFLPDALETVRQLRDHPAHPRLAYLHAVSGGIERALALGCGLVHPHYDLCDREYAEKAHDAGLVVNAWTVADPRVGRRLARDGADGAIADSPAVFE